MQAAQGFSRPTLYRRFNDINAVSISLVTSIMLDVMNQCYRLVDTVEDSSIALLNFVIRVREQPPFRSTRTLRTRLPS
ncbi:MAG: hypothetical protein U1U88_001951 [Lawsonella clevelandensis]